MTKRVGKNGNGKPWGDSKIQSELCKRRIRHERALAERLKQEGFQVYFPTVVCDRIAVKDGTVFFVEFKKNGQTLRSGQETIRQLVPANYVIVYYDPTKL